MWLKLRRTVTAILLLGSALLLMGSTPGCGLQYDDSIDKNVVRSGARSRVDWLPDGSAILFSRGIQGTFLVDVAGTRMRKIPGTTWEKDAVTGTWDRFGSMSAALSPDGSRVAYVAYVGRPGSASEIMIADLEGSDVTTINHDGGNLSPKWSPDGNRIAYLSGQALTIVDADGSNERTLVHVGNSYLPVWSPDGRWIAFVGYQKTRGAMEKRAYLHAVLTLVRPDSSGLTTLEAVGGVSHKNQTERAIANSSLIVLGSLASMPAWSPDGSRIAFFQVEEGSVALYTVELASALAEGPIEARNLLSVDIEIVPRPLDQEYLWYKTLSWSPDGTALLFASEHTQGHVVSVADGRVIADVGPGWAAWSPDGARIAVVTSISTHFTGYGLSSQEALPDLRDVLYTMAQDGTDKQVLVRGNLDQFVAAGVE